MESVTYPIFIGTLTTMTIAFVGGLWAVYHSLSKRLDLKSTKLEDRLYDRLESSAEGKRQQSVIAYQVDLLLGKEVVPNPSTPPTCNHISRPPASAPTPTPTNPNEYQEVASNQILSMHEPPPPLHLAHPPPSHVPTHAYAQREPEEDFINFFHRSRVLKSFPPEEDR